MYTPRTLASFLLLSLVSLAGPKEDLPRQSNVLRVGRPVLVAGAGERFARLEFKIPLEATYANPFDPEDIRVDATIRLPDGKTVTVPAFYYQGWEPENGKTQMQLSVRYRRLAGEDGWRLRFAPAQVGAHEVFVTATQRDGKTDRSPATSFAVADSSRRGFIQVCKQNPMHFADSATGRPFVGTGANVAWTRSQDPGDPIPCYEYYFGKARGNMNATRVWLCHWAWLEWTPAEKVTGTNWDNYAGVGYYNQQIAIALDRVFRLADDAGLRVMLVTEDNNEHFAGDTRDAWTANPYNLKNGGPCEKPGDVFGSAEAQSWYRKRLRYIVARWGAETALWAINSWNDCSTPSATQLAWLRGMRDEVHALTEGWRPLIYGSNFAREANAEMDYAQAGTELRTDRPNVTQECHYADRNEWFRPVLREQLWQGFARGKAAVMVWPHVTVDRTGSWDTFRPVMAFMDQLPLAEGAWRDVEAKATRARAAGAPPYRTLIEFGPYGDVPSWGYPSEFDRFEIDPLKGNQWLLGFTPNLYGQNRKAWRRPPTFAFTLPSAGAFILDGHEIGSGTQTLEITVDGSAIEPVSFADGRRYLNKEERWTRVTLPPGKHEVRVNNTGADWLRLRKLYLAWDIATPAGLVQATGRTNGDEGFVYLQNLSYSRVAQEVLQQTPQDLDGIQLVVPGLVKDARYAVRVLDTSTGKDLQPQQRLAPTDGALSVAVRHLGADAVIHFQRLGN